jgi:hypothetical protein
LPRHPCLPPTQALGACPQGWYLTHCTVQASGHHRCDPWHMPFAVPTPASVTHRQVAAEPHPEGGGVLLATGVWHQLELCVGRRRRLSVHSCTALSPLQQHHSDSSSRRQSRMPVTSAAAVRHTPCQCVIPHPCPCSCCGLGATLPCCFAGSQVALRGRVTGWSVCCGVLR